MFVKKHTLITDGLEEKIIFVIVNLVMAGLCVGSAPILTENQIITEPTKT